MRAIVFILLVCASYLSLKGQGHDGQSFRNYKFSASLSTDFGPFYTFKTKPVSNTFIRGINLEISPYNKFTGQFFYRYVNIKNDNFEYTTAIAKDNDFLPVNYQTAYSSKIHMMGLNCRIYLVRHSYQSPWGKYLYYGINTINYNLKPATNYYTYKEYGVWQNVNLPYSNLKRFTLWGLQAGYGRKFYLNSAEHLFLEYQCGLSITHLNAKPNANNTIDEQIRNALIFNSTYSLSRRSILLLQVSFGYSL